MANNTFIDRLKLLIEELANDNKTEFARLIGEQAGQVNKWVNKGQSLSNKHFAKIAQHLNVNLNWLLTGEGDKYIKQEPLEEGEGEAKDLAPSEVAELLANLNQLPAVARDAVVSQVKTLAEEFDKANKVCHEVDEGGLNGEDVE